MTHVTLKVVGIALEPAHQQLIKVRSGPTVNCAYEPWSCGLCGTYTSSTNTYRRIAKTCTDHSCLIPKDDA